MKVLKKSLTFLLLLALLLGISYQWDIREANAQTQKVKAEPVIDLTELNRLISKYGELLKNNSMKIANMDAKNASPEMRLLIIKSRAKNLHSKGDYVPDSYAERIKKSNFTASELKKTNTPPAFSELFPGWDLKEIEEWIRLERILSRDPLTYKTILNPDSLKRYEKLYRKFQDKLINDPESIAKSRTEFSNAAIEEGENPATSNINEADFIQLDARSRVIKSRNSKPNGELVYTFNNGKIMTKSELEKKYPYWNIEGVEDVILIKGILYDIAHNKVH